MRERHTRALSRMAELPKRFWYPWELDAGVGLWALRKLAEHGLCEADDSKVRYRITEAGLKELSEIQTEEAQ